MSLLRPLFLSIAAGSLLLAAGCASPLGGSCHKPQAHAEAENLPPLRVPAGLDGPDTSAALKVPPVSEAAVPVDPDGPCLDAPPAITAPPLPPSAESVLEEAAARRGRGGRSAEQEEETERRRRPPRPR
ncbi:MAG TPA: hypothetical protein VMK82_01020 [Steroidobacteraceae bacterium]|nr:hypothetical protein [Steroidobacteraceae bacterium]